MTGWDNGVTRREAAGLVAAAAGTSIASSWASAQTTNKSFANPTVEWMVDPAGVDTRFPRFRWQPQGDQMGFRIRIRDLLTNRLILDTGRIQTDAPAGAPMQRSRSPTRHPTPGS
jgi:hypothetical protein